MPVQTSVLGKLDGQRRAEFVWGGPPPFDTTASGTWDLRDDGIHLNGAGIQFLVTRLECLFDP